MENCRINNNSLIRNIFDRGWELDEIKFVRLELI